LFASYTPVELPGAGTGIVADINDGGDAVGVADGAGAIWRVEVSGEQHAAIWVGGVRIDAGVPPDGTSSEFTGAANGRFVGIADVPTLTVLRSRG
jgi:hypothetical protein